MESSEREPSYYEVALTNRQVVIGLVVGLSTILVAFLAGVWIGQDGASPARTATAVESPTAVAAGSPVDRLTFFGDKGPPTRPVAAPARKPPPAESEEDKLRQTLEAEMAANRALPAASTAADTAAPAAAGTRVRRGGASAASSKQKSPVAKRAAPAVVAESLSVPAAEGAPLWIQVYSSTNGTKANEISARLSQNNFQVRVLESSKGATTTYRVRVGPYAARDQADLAASRLRREFRLDTWVTDTL